MAEKIKKKRNFVWNFTVLLVISLSIEGYFSFFYFVTTALILLFFSLSCSAIMPPDSGAEFAAHLEQSVRALRDLRSELSTDIFITYCQDNVPVTPEDIKDLVHPQTIADDLKEEGYKV